MTKPRPAPYRQEKPPCDSLCPTCKAAYCEDRNGRGHSGGHHHGGTHFWM